MEYEELDYKLIARYLAGECTLREQEHIEDWANKCPENKKKLNELRQVYNASQQKRCGVSDLFNPESQWKELQARLRDEGDLRSKINNADHGSEFRSSTLHSATQKIMRVAAIFLVAGLVGVFAYQNWYQPEPKAEEPVLREVSTANAQRANLTLGDGTKVMLNAGSNVKFPDRFEEDVREVYLEGEAFFDVVRNSEKPFVVHSRGSVIRVLGTSFSVRSYNGEDQVRVVVREGKISFEGESSTSDSKTYLQARELGRYYLNEKKIETAQVADMELFMSWKEGYLKFRKEPMQNVAKELERRYGIDVKFKDSEIKEKSLTAFLKSRSIQNVLEVVAMSLDVEYQLQDDQVSFYVK